MTSDDLIEGYRRFRSGGWEDQRERWRTLADGQSPRTMVIACSDSRVDPAMIFDAAPGELFIVRNVANLVPPFEVDEGRHGVSAAVEFAVNQLEVKDIWVVGHEACAGVAAALSRSFVGAEPGYGGMIAHWVDLLDDARDRIVAEYGENKPALAELERQAVKVSLANLRTFPCIPPRERDGRLRLRGGFFAIASGHFYVLDESGDRFTAV